MVGKREQNKLRTRAALQEAAWTLMLERGFDATTVAEIADRAEVVERTFYRYFESKESVLFDGWRAQLTAFEEYIRARPPGEPVVTSLQAYTDLWAEQNESGLDRGRQRIAIAEASKSVRDYERTHVFSTMRQSVQSVVAERLDVSTDDFRVPLLAGMFIELLMAAKGRWLATGGSLKAHVHEAWRAYEALSGGA